MRKYPPVQTVGSDGLHLKLILPFLSSVTLENITKLYYYLHVPDVNVWLAHTLPCSISLVSIVVVIL